MKVRYRAVKHDPRRRCLKRLAKLEDEIAKGREALWGLLE